MEAPYFMTASYKEVSNFTFAGRSAGRSRENERTWVKMGTQIHGIRWGYEKIHLYEYCICIYIYTVDGLGLEKLAPKRAYDHYVWFVYDI